MKKWKYKILWAAGHLQAKNELHENRYSLSNTCILSIGLTTIWYYFLPIRFALIIIKATTRNYV
jgi:hypothetical protein